MNDQMAQYRDCLVRGRDEAMASFDKAIMSMSGGALAIALGFVRAKQPDWIWLLVASWILFTVSLLSILTSFLTSKGSFDSQLAQLDDVRVDEGRIHREKAGGRNAIVTERLNMTAFAAFLFGLIFLGAFVGWNFDKLGAN
jgi:hypothetical protein